MYSQNISYLSNLSKLKNINNLMLFDLETTGHHLVYIKYLVRYWCDLEIAGVLDVVVSPAFMEEAPDIVKIANEGNRNNIRFIPISVEEYSHYASQKSTLARSFLEWRLYCQYAQKLSSQHALLMYFDSLQLPILLGANSPCPFSGIYFRPTFHYQDFDNYHLSWGDLWRQWRQKILLTVVMRNVQLKSLFSLDGFAVKYIQKLNDKVKVLYLPDPVEVNLADLRGVDYFREEIGIDKGKRIFLLFGSLGKRKGIYQLLEAIKLLPRDLCESLCFLLVGSILESDRVPIQTLVTEIAQLLPIQIITINEFVLDKDVPLYFQVADVVLAPYQHHVGMSGIVLLAAAAKKPLISSDYGLMGHIVNKYQIGMTINSESPHAIANSIIKFSCKDIMRNYCNPKEIDDWLKQHSIETFVTTLLVNIFNKEKMSS